MTTVSEKPCRGSSRSTCSMIGLLTIGSSGLGMLAVIGRSRVPSPPAITTAFTPAHLLPGPQPGHAGAPSGSSRSRLRTWTR